MIWSRAPYESIWTSNGALELVLPAADAAGAAGEAAAFSGLKEFVQSREFQLR